jgi:ribosomal protein S8
LLIVKLSLQYHNIQSSFHDIHLISKPSHKIFITYKELRYVLKFWEGNQSYFLISTSKGILNYKEAIQAGVGGFVLARIS